MVNIPLFAGVAAKRAGEMHTVSHRYAVSAGRASAVLNLSARYGVLRPADQARVTAPALVQNMCAMAARRLRLQTATSRQSEVG